MMTISKLEKLCGYFTIQPDGCWLWTGLGFDNWKPRDYAQTELPGYRIFVHRLMYELMYGKIPEGLQIDHLCRVRRCINPKHLEAVTGKENVRRGTQAEVNRQRGLARTHCKNGHRFTQDNIYRVPKTGIRACRKCQYNRNLKTKARIPIEVRRAYDRMYYHQVLKPKRLGQEI